MLWFSEANLDAALAEVLYALDLDPVAHPYFEDVPETLQQLKRLGVKVAVVSDIHFDLRPEFALIGIDGLVDAYLLSFEHGVQKPDPRIFMLSTLACPLIRPLWSVIAPRETVELFKWGSPRCFFLKKADQCGICIPSWPWSRHDPPAALVRVRRLLPCPISLPGSGRWRRWLCRSRALETPDQ